VQFALSRENSGTVNDVRQACHALNRRFYERTLASRRRLGRSATLHGCRFLSECGGRKRRPPKGHGCHLQRLDRGIPAKGGPRRVESASSGPQRTRLLTAYRAPKGVRVRVDSRTVSEETRSRPSASDLDPSASPSRRSGRGSPKRPDGRWLRRKPESLAHWPSRARTTTHKELLRAEPRRPPVGGRRPDFGARNRAVREGTGLGCAGQASSSRCSLAAVRLTTEVGEVEELLRSNPAVPMSAEADTSTRLWLVRRRGAGGSPIATGAGKRAGQSATNYATV